MPSSYTTSLRLTLPATGELTGTWGTTVNTGITELLDSAVAGTTTISTWGGAGVPYTLSNTDGAADEARRMFLVATGAPGEAKNVICPAVSKLYIFRNDTTGGFALTLKTSGGSGIAVPAGQYKVLYCNGTNVVEAFNSLASLTLGTALAVTSGGTGTTTSTGTGSVVLSNSPTLVTPALGTPISGVLTNATGLPLTTGVTGTLPAANGGTGQATYTVGDLVYATGTTALSKLGIGASTNVLTSSGSAPQWTAASSVAIGTATNLAGGVAGSVPYQSGAATTTFLGIGAANTVMTSSGTAPQWSTALTGLTGVSTTTATLSSDLTLTGGTANGVLYLNGSKVATSGSALTFDGTLLRSSTYLGLSTNTTPDTSSGDAIFYKSASGATLSGFQVVLETGSAGSRATRYTIDNTGQAIWSVGGSEQMRLTSTGLGIGTSSPSAKLTVTDTNNIPIRFGDIAAAPASQTAVYVGTSTSALSGGNGDLVLIPRTSDARSILFYTGSGTATLRATLDSSGNLGLGVTPSAWGTSAFQTKVASVWGFSNNAYVGCNYYFDGTNRRYIATAAATEYAQFNGQHTWYTAPSGTAGNAISFSQVMTLDSSGNLGIGTSSPGVRLSVDSGAAAIAANFNSTNATGVYLRFQNSGTAIGDLGSGGNLFGGGTVGDFGLTSRAGNLVFGTGSTERMRLDSSGNLGLGVTPSAWDTAIFRTLQVGGGGGSVSLSGRTDGTKDLVLGSNIYYGTGNFRYVGTGVATMYRQDVAAHTWYTAPSGTAGNVISFTQAMTLDASGNLGIGTTSNGVAKIYAYTTSGGVDNFRMADENSTIASGIRAVGDAIAFRTQAAERARITSGGDLGVGTTSPDAKLDVAGTGLVGLFGSESANNAYIGIKYNSTILGYFGNGSGVAGPGSATDLSIGSTGARALTFGTNDLERARITSTGNVVAGGSVALATTATDGFLYVPTCAGTPTGTPTAITGMAPIVVDTTNNKMYFYSGGAWRDAGP